MLAPSTIMGRNTHLPTANTVQATVTARIRKARERVGAKKRLDQFSPEPDPTKNIGIRLVSRIAKEMEYQNNAGINTVIIKL